jgi:serine protease
MRAPRAPAWAATALAWVALLALAGGCVVAPRPALAVDTGVIVLSPGRPNAFGISNVGEAGSVLHFTVTTEVPWLALEPLDGRLEAGASQHVTLLVRPGEVPADGSYAVVSVDSDAGRADVHVVVGEVTGASVCAHDAGSGPSATALGGDRSTAGPTAGEAPPATTPAGTQAAREVLVVYRADLGPAATRVGRAALGSDVAARAGASLVRAGSGLQHDLVRLPAHAPEAARAALERDPRVALVVPNLPVHRAAVPDDPGYVHQWWAWCFGLAEAWQVATGERAVADGAPVIVAVVDDGFNVGHHDLAAKLLPGFDFAEWNDDVRTSISAHGTHVAGVALAQGRNDVAIAGVAHGAGVLLLAVKVFPDDPGRNGSLDALVNGMRWAVGLPVAGSPPNPYPADVVNLSLGVGTAPSSAPLFEATVAEMRARGAVVVAAAGNRGDALGVEYPARAAGVIAVGSVDWTGLRSSFSTHGEGLDLMAPGGAAAPSAAGACPWVLSLGPLGPAGTACMAGTSMAAPFVSGTAALLIADDPERYRRQPEAVEARLLATALKGWDMSTREYGAGLVCADAALGTRTRCGWSRAE